MLVSAVRLPASSRRRLSKVDDSFTNFIRAEKDETLSGSLLYAALILLYFRILLHHYSVDRTSYHSLFALLGLRPKGRPERETGHKGVLGLS
jgi:hypothetical protein